MLASVVVPLRTISLCVAVLPESATAFIVVAGSAWSTQKLLEAVIGCPSMSSA